VIDDVKSFKSKLEVARLRKAPNANIPDDRAIQIREAGASREATPRISQQGGGTGRSETGEIYVRIRISWIYRIPTAGQTQPFREIVCDAAVKAEGVAGDDWSER
jgi:hypothetical protein